MDWLSQNWGWLAVAVGGLFMIAHHLGFGGHGMSGSMAHGGGSGSSDRGEANLAAPVVDPVSHQRLPADVAVSSVYRGRAYNFENRENRDAFERETEKYLAVESALGHPIGMKSGTSNRPRRHSGCC